MPARSPEDILRLFEDGSTPATPMRSRRSTSHRHPRRRAPAHRQGTEAILDGLKNFIAVKPRMVLNASRIVRNGDIAILYSDWTMTGRARRVVVLRRRAPTVVVREHTDGVWRRDDDPSVDTISRTALTHDVPGGPRSAIRMILFWSSAMASPPASSSPRARCCCWSWACRRTVDRRRAPDREHRGQFHRGHRRRLRVGVWRRSIGA